MASLTYADLIAEFPELATPDASEQTRIGRYLDSAEHTLGDVFRTAARRDHARLLYAAHLTALGHRSRKHGGGGTGPVTGQTSSEGETVTYQPPPQWQGGLSNLGATPYGVELAPILMSARYRRPVVA